MKKFIYLLVIVVIFLSIQSCSKKSQKNQVCIKENCVDVEIVKTDESRQRGLMERDYLSPDEGMLFVFNKNKIYSFWMKDTWIPLDIIWMDYARRIVFIAKNVAPCEDENPCPSYTPDKESLYVLEVNSGYSEANGIEVGDIVEFKLLD